MKDIPQNPPIAGPAPDKELKDWKVYEVANSDLVVGLDKEPVVVTSLPSGRLTYSQCWGQSWDSSARAQPRMENGWECTTAPWWVNRDELGTAYAQTGPSDWLRVRASDLARAEPRPVSPVQVANVKTSVDSISFDVSDVGKPVEVKESYFPNWHVKGAEGPYRLAPNLMVVVPTSKHVELTYGLTGADWAGRFVTAVGAVGLVLLGLWTGARRHAAGDDGLETDPSNDGGLDDDGSDAVTPRDARPDDEETNPSSEGPPGAASGDLVDPAPIPSEGDFPDRREPVRAVP